MINLCDLSRLRRILCLGAHSDDIEIGCGGTMLRLLEDNPQVAVCWIVFGAKEQAREEEARRSAGLFLGGARETTITIKNFQDSYFPYIGDQIKEYFETLKSFQPDLIFTHRGDDRHQDHRLISDLTWNCFRNHLILEYEIPKYDGDLGQPNLFSPLSEGHARMKVKHLFDCFGTQKDRQWFTEDTFWSLMRLRGIESNSPSRFAEGFYCRKMTL